MANSTSRRRCRRRNPHFRMTALIADVTGHTCNSPAGAGRHPPDGLFSRRRGARARGNTNAAKSDVRGDGEWRLEGDTRHRDHHLLQAGSGQLRPGWTPEAQISQPVFRIRRRGIAYRWADIAAPGASRPNSASPSSNSVLRPMSGLPAGKLVLHNNGPFVATCPTTWSRWTARVSPAKPRISPHRQSVPPAEKSARPARHRPPGSRPAARISIAISLLPAR